jgi:hypothetical protein
MKSLENFTKQKVTDTSQDIFKAGNTGTISPKKPIILREFC